MNKLSPKKLKRGQWHAFQAEEIPSRGLKRVLTPELVIPGVVLLVLVLLKAFWMAAIVAGFALLILGIRYLSGTGSRLIDRFFGFVANLVGQIVALILLAPAFFMVMPLVRLVNRFTGNDPLALRSSDAPSFWVPSDIESRRIRHARSMFCTERLSGSRLALVPIAALFAILLVAAEAGLRIYGFGTPVLYVQDADVGYYPRPNQRVRAPGRVITINNHSMRSPDVPAEKNVGHVRILLLGDSTLAGTWVSNGELYSSLLEKRLNELAGAEKFEVYNMGVNAWGPFHELAFVKKFGTFGADVAVICGPVYNAYRPHYTIDRLPFFPETHPPRLALEQILYDLTWRYREKWLGPPEWTAGERAELQCRSGIDAYHELVGYLQEHGAEVFVQMLPTSSEALGVSTDPHKNRILSQLNERLRDLGVTAECAGKIFTNVPTPGKIYHDGVHFDRLGHKLYANYFAERLIQNSLRVQKALRPGIAVNARPGF